MEIKLACGKIAFIDEEDLRLFEGKRTWRSYFDGWNWYVRRQSTVNKKSKTFLLHREVLSITDGKIIIDHIDGNGLNNMKSNLRICTHSQNRKNRHNKSCKHTSKYLGVSLKTTKYKYRVKSGEERASITKRWEARIQHNKKQISIGFYNTEEEAAIAYNEKAIEFHGEFASLNKIDK
jgi:hypothetical protein